MNRKTVTIIFVVLGLFMMVQSVMANSFLALAYILGAAFTYGLAFIESELNESPYRLDKDKYIWAKIGVTLTIIGFALKVGGAVALHIGSVA